MPNHARRLEPKRTLPAVLILVSAVLCSCQAAASRESVGSEFSMSDPAHARTIVAEGSRGQRLEIAGAAGGDWSALLVRQGRQTRASGANCPAFAEAMAAFRRLPTLKPGPYELQTHPDVRPIPPTTKDGEFWVITTPGFFPDWSDVTVVLRGDQGPYANWASETARVVSICDGQ